MKNIILTGSTGTIGQPLNDLLVKQGYNVIPWRKDKISISDYHQMENFVLNAKADAIIHLAAITSLDPNKRMNSWLVNYEWPSELAWISRVHRLRFIFISSAMVFSPDHQGPYYPESSTSTIDGYGFEKRKAEERVLYQNPESVIIRLGWQIAENGNNSMLLSLEDEMINHGKILAETHWLPSCSFIEDTIEIVYQSLQFNKGIYQVNANQDLSFFEIARLLKAKYKKNWIIEAVNNLTHDQRMFDERFEFISPLHIKLVQ